MHRKKCLYTIGHSNRTIDYFLDLLDAYDIELVVDVRTVPRSKKNPQFDQENLKCSLKERKIGYFHLKSLGGWRHAKKDSPNTGFENASFRGYADYMQTKEFKDGLKDLTMLAKESNVSLLCAEAVPWRCHRSLIADALTLQDWQVFHIQSKKTAKLHALTPFLKVEGKQIIYPKV